MQFVTLELKVFTAQNLFKEASINWDTAADMVTVNGCSVFDPMEAHFYRVFTWMVNNAYDELNTILMYSQTKPINQENLRHLIVDQLYQIMNKRMEKSSG